MSELFGKNVEELTLKDFKIINLPNKKVDVKFINPKFAGKNGMVVSYAPWCPHCHNIAPEIMELARVTKGLYPIYAINSEDTKNGNNILMDNLGITGYPTIKLLKEGKFKDYTGGRNLTELLRHICLENGLCEFL
jgi:thiol-disulfide isomerase/thioredoxin